ncbi:hypothetical protein WR25_26413 [Diploscapter pachys]|uniref:Uncharacterized protein n=1 Tax=Diploscapter pachys TaxID=2018661 RepID=A0A2A2M1H8_9BILA|nr:hypothetical protein WR25_26413 [Diploscapter pachys]
MNSPVALAAAAAPIAASLLQVAGQIYGKAKEASDRRASEDREYKDREERRKHEREMLEAKHNNDLSESERNFALKKQQLDNDLTLTKQKYETELRKEEEETRRIEEMLKAGNSTLEALKLQEERQKKAQEEFDRQTNEKQEAFSEQTKILEEENKRRHDKAIAQYQQRLRELKEESEADRRKMEDIKKAEMALYAEVEDRLNQKHAEQREEIERRLKAAAEDRSQMSQQLIEQLKTAKDEMEKRHAKEKAWLEECKNKEISEFKSILGQLNDEAEKVQKVHNEKMIELQQNLRRELERGEQLRDARMTMIQTQTERMVIINNLNDSTTVQQPYRLIFEKNNRMKSAFDKKTLDLRLKGKDILKARKIKESKKEYSTLLDEFNEFLRNSYDELVRDIASVRSMTQLEGHFVEQAHNALENIHSQIRENFLLELDEVSCNNLNDTSFAKFEQNIKKLSGSFEKLPVLPNALDQLRIASIQMASQSVLSVQPSTSANLPIQNAPSSSSASQVQQFY